MALVLIVLSWYPKMTVSPADGGPVREIRNPGLSLTLSTACGDFTFQKARKPESNGAASAGNLAGVAWDFSRVHSAKKISRAATRLLNVCAIPGLKVDPITEKADGEPRERSEPPSLSTATRNVLHPKIICHYCYHARSVSLGVCYIVHLFLSASPSYLYFPRQARHSLVAFSAPIR